MKICDVDGCERIYWAKGWCLMHYKRVWRGQPLGEAQPQQVHHGFTSRDKTKVHSLYKIWETMRQRCNNPKRKEYKNYGGRGITVCERWNDFANFVSDMGERPANTTLDRINNDGNYEPSNCRWADRHTQNMNKRKNNATI